MDNERQLGDLNDQVESLRVELTDLKKEFQVRALAPSSLRVLFLWRHIPNSSKHVACFATVGFFAGKLDTGLRRQYHLRARISIHI